MKNELKLQRNKEMSKYKFNDFLVPKSPMMHLMFNIYSNFQLIEDVFKVFDEMFELLIHSHDINFSYYFNVLPPQCKPI